MIREGIVKITAVCLLLMGVVACSDNSAGPEVPDNPPEIPDMTAAQPDFSYFGSPQKDLSKLQDGHAYQVAQSMAFSAQAFFSFSDFAYGFFSMAESEEPEFINGEWVWTYTSTAQGVSMEFRVTAMVNETAGEIDWAQYITVTGGEQEFEDYKFMEGTTSIDGNSGDWQINDFLETGTPEPVMTYEWNIDNADDMTASFEIHDEEGGTIISYDQEKPAHTLTLDGSGSVFELFWDADADIGYWIDDSEGVKHCWSAGAQIACNDVGL